MDSSEEESPKSCRKLHVCDYLDCGASFSRPNRLLQHSRIHTGERPFKCTQEGCDKSYSRRQHLKRHEANHNAASSEKLPLVHKCFHELCNKSFETWDSLQRHQKLDHLDGVTVYRCSECSEQFRKHNLLKSHMFVHTGVMPYKCEAEGCSKTFIVRAKLNRHIKDVHEKVNYYCTKGDCRSVLFPTWSLFVRHQKEVHPRKYICAVCDKSFLTKANCRLHFETHNGENRRKFTCSSEGCTKSYFQRKNLINHIRKAHERLRLPCQEDGCKMVFVSQQKLDQHMLKMHDPTTPCIRLKKQGPRNRRKDTGTIKRSMAAKLAECKIPYIEEQKILRKSFKEIGL